MTLEVVRCGCRGTNKECPDCGGTARTAVEISRQRSADDAAEKARQAKT
jgi:hypothetical protein